MSKPTTVQRIKVIGGRARLVVTNREQTMGVSGETRVHPYLAAIHAAWVWLKDHSKPISPAEVAAPSVVLGEATRREPTSEWCSVYRMQKRLLQPLVDRLRGFDWEDPFELRAELLRL